MLKITAYLAAYCCLIWLALSMVQDSKLKAQAVPPAAPAAPAAPATISMEDQARVRTLQAEALSAESTAKQLFNQWLLTEEGRRFSEVNQRAVQFNNALEITIRNLQTKYGAAGYELKSSPDGSSLVWVTSKK